jgi:serine protease DegQ
MLNLIAALKPNQKATVQIARAEQTLNISILIGKRPKPAIANE